MRRIVLRATASKLTRALVVISPASTTRLFLTSVSAATRERGSWARIASSTASEIWSATLSGCPSDTDSEVNRNSLIACAFLWEGARIPKLVFPQRSPASRREAAAAAVACVGKRPRLADLWDLAHLSQEPPRQPAAGRLHRCAHPPRGDRRGRQDARRAARGVVPLPRRGRRNGAQGARHGAGARRARRKKAAAFSHSAHGLLRNHRAVRRSAHAAHGALPAAQDEVAGSAHARRPQPA